MTTLTPDTPHTGMLAWVYHIPIPQTKILLGITLSVGTFLTVWVAFLLGREVSEGALAVLLSFVAALFGIAAFDYRTKRNTDLDFEAAKKGPAVQVANVEKVTVEGPTE